MPSPAPEEGNLDGVCRFVGSPCDDSAASWLNRYLGGLLGLRAEVEFRLAVDGDAPRLAHWPGPVSKQGDTLLCEVAGIVGYEWFCAAPASRWSYGGGRFLYFGQTPRTGLVALVARGGAANSLFLGFNLGRKFF